MKVSRELREWLEIRWRDDNHVRYQKYFSEWIQNITKDQIIGFEKQMITFL